ncbi:MAG: glycerol-3-phosphate 1-O-acyltransferase PlsY [bacterium]
MMTIRPEYLVVVPGAYLIGAIPFGLLYSLYVEREDLREEGSGNIGATNVLRNFGWPAGVITLLLDAAKGAVPSYAALTMFPGDPRIWIFVGGSAILGHVFPVYLGFDGGKGVATSAGVFAVLLPLPLAVGLTGFFLAVGITRYMSVGSLIGALLLPGYGTYLYGFTHPTVLGAWVLAFVVYWRHRGNIRRLLNGEEETFL